MKTTYAWHFTGPTLRDGSPIPPIGKKIRHSGPIVPCESGLHFSLEPYDALQYAPGSFLHLVRIDGEYLAHSNDKGVADNRTIIASLYVEELLRYFARMQALSMVHLWNAPDLVLDFLMTGDSSISAAARAAAMDAACDAARAAACDAARAAAYAAAYAAASAAAYAAASAAARVAARKDFNNLVYECFEGPLENLK